MIDADTAVPKITEALGYTFRDATLLRAALTHRSYSSENRAQRSKPVQIGGDNERLEFLGDAVLGLVVAEALWTRAPEADEGELSRLRASVVNESSLATAALSLHLGEGLRLGRGEDRSGGRTRPSMLADALEAVIAAVYLDAGFESARAVILRALSGRIEEAVVTGVRDDKSTLQEWLQARHRITPRYEVVATYGPDHDREHEVELRAGEVVTARGRGRSKKDAEQAAARAALATLSTTNEPDDQATAKPVEAVEPAGDGTPASSSESEGEK